MSNSLRLSTLILLGALCGLACAQSASKGEIVCSALADKNLPPETLATVEGQPITAADFETTVHGRAKGAFLKAKIEFFEAKKEALDDYLYNRLIDEKAKKEGKTSEQVIEAEVTKKTKKVTEKEIQAFYDNIKKQRGGGMGRQIPALDKNISDQIRKNLEQGAVKERKDQFFAELRKKFKVAYLIDTPRIPVEMGSLPPRGNEKAPITIVEFSDFECPYCKRASQTVEEVLKAYKGKVKIFFRDYPLPFHSKAKPAAMAARCAAEQGKFWEYHDKLFAKQELAPEKLTAYAKELKLDSAKFEECVKSEKFKDDVEKDIEAGSEVGVSGTPAYFVNGRMLSGALPLEAFKEVIDKELARKG